MPIATPNGVLIRALFVRLPAGAVINPHIDGQAVATKAHRIHVCISDCPECVYAIGEQSFTMTPGVAYDFNNRWQHAVHNAGDTPRINLMLEYLPNPEWVFPVPLMLQGPEGLGVRIETGAIPRSPICELIVARGGVERSEAYRVLNMGIGMVLFVRPDDVDEVLSGCLAAGEQPFLVGDVVASETKVSLA